MGRTFVSKHATLFPLVVAVAQLVESRIVIPVVVGSSPISHPNIEKPASIEAGFFPFAFHGYL